MQERAALSRLELAKWEYDQSEQLHQKGVITDQTARRNRMALEAANAEYEIAAKKARMASKAVDVDMVKRLSDVRIEIQPVKAKIESLEEFLDTMQQASETFSQIKQLKRQQQLLESDLALVARALFESTRKSIELRIYQSLVENERKPSTKREDQ